VYAVVAEQPILVAAGVLEVEERGALYGLLGVWNAVPHVADVDGRHTSHRQNALRVVVEVTQLVNQVPAYRPVTPMYELSRKSGKKRPEGTRVWSAV